MFDRQGMAQLAKLAQQLPPGLLQTMARGAAPDYCQAAGMDRVEAWLAWYLDCGTGVKFETYPPWAMLGVDPDADDSPPAFSRFWGSMVSLNIERDGVSLTPPEGMDISSAHRQAFWDVVQPILESHGWDGLARQNAQVGEAPVHRLLNTQQPMFMEQGSPWSVQNARLTDYLPMHAECAAWRRMWLKIQVELHNAPFNQERQAQGLPPLNALWFWGGGHAWWPGQGLPSVKVVGLDGAQELNGLQANADEVGNRFAFWCTLLAPGMKAFHAAQSRKPSTVACVAFEGWGGNMAPLQVLESDILKPMRLAGLSHAWVLLGQAGWKVLQSSWRNRLMVWKNKPDLNILKEPDLHPAPTEAELQEAWVQGQAQQDTLMGEIQHPGGPK